MSIPLRGALAQGQLSQGVRIAQGLMWVWDGSGHPVLQLGPTGTWAMQSPLQHVPSVLCFLFGTQGRMSVGLEGASTPCQPLETGSPGGAGCEHPAAPPAALCARALCSCRPSQQLLITGTISGQCSLPWINGGLWCSQCSWVLYTSAHPMDPHERNGEIKP